MYSPHTKSANEWYPPIPPAERMRNLDVYDVYSQGQIDFMRDLSSNTKLHKNDRNEKMANNYSDGPQAENKNTSANIQNVDARNTDVLDSGVLKKEDTGRSVVHEFISVSKHLDDDFVELLLAEARHRARIPAFVERVLEAKNIPKQYAESPRNLRLPEFIKQEWINKGFLPHEIDRQMLAAYDSKLVRAIENYEYNHGPLDQSMSFPKVGNRRSKREMKMHLD